MLRVLIYILITLNIMYSSSSFGNNLDSKINEILTPISNSVSNFVFYSPNFGNVSIPIILVWLIVAALFCTLYFGFINFRYFGTALSFLSSKKVEKNAPGEVTHKQALWTATAATVGLGNIAGVAIAVSLGGPGATFWMIVAGLLGMSLKFCECTLGVKYRVINEDGSVSSYLSSGSLGLDI